ncbi:MAG: tyrosine-type recombinase/integrase [gamma proteobacterium symbiont of Taylorina sp.]|nr:tyrosine-type recombinase/integrase [gamma proteobacterium symbiont of Taylorina sp.]
MKLDQIDIETIEIPKYKQRQYFSSARFRGLQLIVKNNGRKEWHFRFTGKDGKRNSIKLGDWPDMDEDKAILEAEEQKHLVKKGVDPVINNKIIRQQKTKDEYRTGMAISPQYRFNVIAGDFLNHKEVTVKPATVKKYRSALNVHLLPEIGGSDIRFLDMPAYERLISTIAKNSKSAAQNCHSTTRALFSFAVENELIIANPLMGKKSLVKRIKVQPNKDFLSPAQLHNFLNELNDQPLSEDAKKALMIQIYTGLRIGEILAIEWDKIDFRSRKIIHDDSKTGEIYTIMSDAVRRILLEWKRDTSERNCNRVFKDKLDTQQIVDEMRKIKAWLPFGSHALRKTVRTYLQELGCPHEIRKIITNHSLPSGIDAHYEFSDQDEAQLHWLTLWAEKLEQVKESATALHKGIDVAEDDPLLAEFGDLL